MNRNYVGDEDLLNSGAFPGGRDVSGLPPALMLDADHDTLRASGERFAAELAAGVPVSYTVVPHSWHGYLDRAQLNGFRLARCDDNVAGCAGFGQATATLARPIHARRSRTVATSGDLFLWPGPHTPDVLDKRGHTGQRRCDEG
ncbi:alpha/beta hydrolase fold domain-containing protein [Nocardia asiatica]|uniref:alpha/beta hydrolase fold domain-containing protein n=1 Tax=Nocardia asiatica TaxID=209252 RepID=UPI000A05FD26|nr:alpha/beta hydrolase fold domain-containing protein [Nocardia asiatica]